MTTISKIGFVSLGCPKNLVDSEQMLATLVDAGYELVADHNEAHAIIINTCGFVESAKDESVEVINEAVALKETANVKRVIAAGCLVQRQRAHLLDLCPGVDAMIGVFDRDHIVDAMQKTTAKEEIPQWIEANAVLAARARGMQDTNGYLEDDSNRLQLTPRHWTYLRVSEGCNQNCTFCTIPSIRGKMRSKPVEVIIKEAKQLMSSGVFELNLIGQDTTSYGNDIGYDTGLVGLLSELNKTVTNSGSSGWIRLMYAYPNNFTDEMMEAMAQLPCILPYIDIPLQHASNSVLKAMRRNVSATEQSEMLERLRETIPGVAIRTTLITGFPGETEQDHQELLDFILKNKFDALGVFKYSKEDGTVAGSLEEDDALKVPDSTKQKREEELMLTQQEIAFEKAKSSASNNEKHQVLVDSYVGDTGEGELKLYQCRTKYQAPDVDACTILMSEQNQTIGTLVNSTITDCDGYDLIARPTDELEKVVSLPVR
ncbi:MAG: 30S ribosomal protein S12 methylthiotransferase RimO [Phycisphaerales bacterium]|jgi:ribosomal protein S12 methylthiotransferase|nr:30S ribosomal protein S12 methylthiotransferase RimO [Phycisphaerales bacterium]